MIRRICDIAYRKFQESYSTDTETGIFGEDCLYIGSNEELEPYYRSLNGVGGASISVLGGFDQVATLISSADTETDIILDISPYAVEYGNIRLGLCECECPAEYLQRLTSRRLSSKTESGLEQAIADSDIDTIQDVLYSNPADSDFLGETLHRLESAEYLGDMIMAEGIMAKISNEVGIPEASLRSSKEREFTVYPFFDFFRKNPSHWLLDPDRYECITEKFREGRIKLIRGDICGTAMKNLAHLLDENDITVGFIYDSNVMTYVDKRSDRAKNYIDNLEIMPTDGNTLLVSDYGEEKITFLENQLRWYRLFWGI